MVDKGQSQPVEARDNCADEEGNAQLKWNNVFLPREDTSVANNHHQANYDLLSDVYLQRSQEAYD